MAFKEAPGRWSGFSNCSQADLRLKLFQSIKSALAKLILDIASLHDTVCIRNIRHAIFGYYVKCLGAVFLLIEFAENLK